MTVLSCPCCPTDCAIATWNGEDLTQFTTSGSVSIDAGEILISGAGSITFIAVPDEPTDPVRLVVRLKAESGKIRLRLGELDSDDFVFVEFDRDAETIQLGQSVSGDESLFGDPTEITYVENQALYLCWADGGPRTEMELVAAKYPTRVVPYSGGGGDPWTNRDNVKRDDANYAEYEFATQNELSDVVSGTSYELGLIPGITIDGIAVDIEARYADATRDVIAEDIHLVLFDGTVSNDEGLDSLIPSTLGRLTFGGPTDVWGLAAGDLTYENFTQGPGVSVYHRYQELDAFPTAVPLQWDFTTLSVYYTTPPRKNGKLQANYGACVTNWTAVASGDKATVQVISGDWRMTSAAYAYTASPAHPRCPACGCLALGLDCDCCDEKPLESYGLDLGDLLFSDGYCTPCSIFSGTIVVDQTLPCAWYWSEEIECECLDEELHPAIAFATLQMIQESGTCKWRATFGINFGTCSGTVVQDPTDEDETSRGNSASFFAVYESGAIAGNACRLPATLTRVSSAIGGSCDDTSDSWPTNIELTP